MTDPQSGVALESRTSSRDALDAHTRLRLFEVLEILKISRSTLYARLKRDEFPLPVRFRRSVRWTRHEVLAYLLDEEIRRG